MPPRKPKVDAKWRNRIVDNGVITADEIEANPANPRVHGDQQKAAMSYVLGEIVAGMLLPWQGIVVVALVAAAALVALRHLLYGRSGC